MSNQWFRMYAEFISDPKVQMMSEQYQRRLIMLFCIRCNGDVTLQDDEIAFQLRIGNVEWGETKREFIKRGFIDDANNLLNWDKRQYRSDSSAERVRKHRESKRNTDVTACNVTVTPPDTEQIQIQIQNTTLACSSAREKSDFQKIYDAGSAAFPKLATASTQVIHEWLKSGCTPQDAVPEIERFAGKDVRAWSYFTGAVMDAKATRTNPLPNGSPRAVAQVYEGADAQWKRMQEKGMV